MFSRRALEALTASLTGAFGIAIVVQSLDNGIGWSSAGVESGTFPFITGVIVTVGSLYNLVRGWRRGREIAVHRASACTSPRRPICWSACIFRAVSL
jgi:hypothetical protein